MQITLDALKYMLEDEDTYVASHSYLQQLRHGAAAIVGHDQPYYSAFYNIARLFKPKFCVELGSWRAVASAHLAIGNPDGQVITIDIHKDDKAAQQAVLDACRNIPNLVYLNGWTWGDDIVDTVASVGEIDLLYIDAWHEYQYAIREWELYKPLLAERALVICDDLFDSAGTTDNMIKFWDEVSYGMKKFVDSKIHPGVPMGFFIYERH